MLGEFEGLGYAMSGSLGPISCFINFRQTRGPCSPHTFRTCSYKHSAKRAIAVLVLKIPEPKVTKECTAQSFFP